MLSLQHSWSVSQKDFQVCFTQAERLREDCDALENRHDLCGDGTFGEVDLAIHQTLHTSGFLRSEFTSVLYICYFELSRNTLKQLPGNS